MTLLFPILAAITINSISPTAISSADDIITILATASGLSDKTQYLQVGFTKEGESPHYLGYTQNNTGNWYVYQSAPPPSEFSAHFYNFTPVSGSWSGNVLAKVDPADPDFKGPGNYVVKLMKYISSSSPTYSNQVIVAVSIAPPPPPPPPEDENPPPPPAPAEAPEEETPPPIKAKTTPLNPPSPEPEINLAVGTVSAAATAAANQIPETLPSPAAKKSATSPATITLVALGTLLSAAAILSVKFKIWAKWLGRV